MQGHNENRESQHFAKNLTILYKIILTSWVTLLTAINMTLHLQYKAQLPVVQMTLNILERWGLNGYNQKKSWPKKVTRLTVQFKKTSYHILIKSFC